MLGCSFVITLRNSSICTTDDLWNGLLSCVFKISRAFWKLVSGFVTSTPGSDLKFTVGLKNNAHGRQYPPSSCSLYRSHWYLESHLCWKLRPFDAFGKLYVGSGIKCSSIRRYLSLWWDHGEDQQRYVHQSDRSWAAYLEAAGRLTAHGWRQAMPQEILDWRWLESRDWRLEIPEIRGEWLENYHNFFIKILDF